MIRKKCKYCGKHFSPGYKKQKFCSVACANKFNCNNTNQFIIPRSKNTELAELFGVLLGDGSVNQYFMKIYCNAVADKGYPNALLKIISKALPKTNPTVVLRPDRGTVEIQISSKKVCDYLRKIGFDPKNRSIPGWILKIKKYEIATIRGLFDTEGSIGIKKYKGKKGIYLYKQLTFTNKNRNLLTFVENTLIKLGFSPTKNARTNIYLSNKEDIKKYFWLVGTNNPKLVKKNKIQ